MGAYTDEVDVKLWLPEFNNYNVTIFCDRLLIKNGELREGFFAITGEVYGYVSSLNLEQQSSGFKILKEIKGEGEPDVLLLKISPENIKNELIIPNKEYVWGGFFWGKDDVPKPKLVPGSFFRKEATTHLVPTSKYGHRYILNFSVIGEFCLCIYFIPKNGEDPIRIFEKSFCCK